MDSVIGTLLTIISAVGFSLMPIFAKFAYEAGVNVITLLSLRFLLAALILWLVLLIKKESFRVQAGEIVALVMLGVLGYGVMSSFYFSSLTLISASMAVIILYTYPVIVTLLSALIYKEVITATKVKALVLSFFGLILVVGVAFRGLNFIGVFYAFGAAVVYSLYILFSNRLVNKISPLVVTTYVASAAAVSLNGFGFITGMIDYNFDSQGWFSILGVAFFSSVIAILTFFEGMKLIGPSKASIISTVEPLVTTLIAFVLFDEKLAMIQLIGGALILLAVILINISKEKPSVGDTAV